MGLNPLENLEKSKKLKRESFNQEQYDGMVATAQKTLADSVKADLELESQFHLAYTAAHSLARAALLKHGYRSEDRYIVFQVLPHTVGVGPEVWRVLDVCHNKRNIAEYSGEIDIDEQLVRELKRATQALYDVMSIKFK